MRRNAKGSVPSGGPSSRRSLDSDDTWRNERKAAARSLGGARPSVPDPEVLRRALERANSWTDADIDAARWVSGSRVDRPQSTLFPLQLKAGDRHILAAYYKVHRIPEGTPEQKARTKLATTRRVLERGPGLTEQFIRLAAHVPARMPRILAADVDQLTEVQVVLPGRAVPRIVAHAIPGRRARLLMHYHRLGEALEAIEECGDDALASTDPWRPDISRGVGRLHHLFDDAARDGLQEILEALLADVRGRSTHTYCHGDMNSDHVLFTGTGVGLVDPLWAVRWRGYDVAHQAWRLEQEYPGWTAWTERVVASLLEGYGDTGLAGRAEWRLAHLWHTTVLAGRRPKNVIDYRRRWRAAKTLASVLGPRRR